MSRILPFCLLLVSANAAYAEAQTADVWIWANGGNQRVKKASFRRTFLSATRLPRRDNRPVAATLTGVAEFCSITVFINGKRVGHVEDYRPKFKIDVTDDIIAGRNVIGVAAASEAGPAAISLRLVLRYKTDKYSARKDLVTGESWRWMRSPPEGWSKPDFQPRGWSKAVELGPVAEEPWGEHSDSVTIRSTDDYTQWKQALGTERGADPTAFSTRPGFQMELLRSAKPGEGSWVGLAFDPKGRLVVAREDKGLLRMTLGGKDRKPVQVETINDTLKECRGLLFAHGALYAHANNSLGLYRLRDTNGDDRFDEVKLLRKTAGGKGHGRNDLALGPDGMIYAIHGDAVEVPRDVPNRASPFRKHSRKGRRGFVLRTDRDGKRWEVVATGMRNPFGIAFNPHGEMFTYDADAEYDMGSSWYRPTRILHLLPGADFGWRAVTRSWPAYDPDVAEAAPPALDIGKGSPTGVRFGTNSRFPGKYRRALYVLDWAYGRVLAVHMVPRGAGYAMRAETFLKGRPFNCTNLAFGPDGAMYLVTGGRKTQSGLYRVSFVGDAKPPAKATPQQTARAEFSKKARKLRRRLEALQRKPDANALKLAWPHLNSPDPVLRYAARMAVEHQPVERWRKRALKEKRPRAALTALLSLAQGGTTQDRSKIVARLEQFDLKSVPVKQQLTALRLYELALYGQRLESSNSAISRRALAPGLRREFQKPGASARRLIKTLDPLFPAESSRVNQKLCELLIALNADKVVPRTMALLAKAKTQRARFHYLYSLRVAKHGWTPELRKRYFRAISRMHGFLGGQGMPNFISRIKADALSQLSAEQKKQFEPLLARKTPIVELPAEAKNRKFVRNWKLEDLTPLLNKKGRRADFEQGRKMFHAAACSACHRIGTVGSAIGPDLTSVGRRFSRKDILESILDPSKVVAEQYRHDVLVTTGGKSYTGTILQRGDYRSNEIEILTDPLKPDSVVKLRKADVELLRKSKTSVMPKGLLDTLTKQEVLDLLAYLASGGDGGHPLYRKAKPGQ